MTTQKEIDNFKAHFNSLVTLAFWIWKYKYVFTVMGFAWGFFATTIVRVSSPYVAPFIVPTITSQWNTLVKPYDSTINLLDDRVTDIEKENEEYHKE